MALLPDQKFSTFVEGGDLEVGDKVVGLRDGLNTQFDWTGGLSPGYVVPLDQGGTGESLVAVNNSVFSINNTGNTELTQTLPDAVQDNITHLGTVVSGTWNSDIIQIPYGGTGVSSVTTTPTASAWSGWDANSNHSANNYLNGYATTVTSVGTTVLTVSSPYLQYFTGTTSQAVSMPVTSTLVLGQSWKIVNNSLDIVVVNSSGGNNIVTLASNSSAIITCILTSGTTNASWDVQFLINLNTESYIESEVTAASGVALTTGTNANVTFIDLPAGLWNIWGNTGFANNGTTMTNITGWISTTSATLPDTSLIASLNVAMTATTSNAIVVPMRHYVFNTTTRVYLSCLSVFSGGTGVKGCGAIRAKRN